MKDILLEIKAEQIRHSEKLDRIETQTIKTNGRVNVLEPIVKSNAIKIEKIGLKLASYSGAIALIIFLANKLL